MDADTRTAEFTLHLDSTVVSIWDSYSKRGFQMAFWQMIKDTSVVDLYINL